MQCEESEDLLKMNNNKIPIIPAPTQTPGFSRESLTYLYGGDTATYTRAIDTTNGSIKTVCPDYFDIDQNGNLLITPPDKIDPAFIKEMQSRGIRVTPFISNHFDRALAHTALDNREKLTTQIADMIERYNFDGVDNDIENANDTYRYAFTDFTRLLREKLPPSKTVSVAVAANPNGLTVGWHGSYDYKALANNSDYLMIMTYDESFYGSAPGPVSSRSFFENSVRYALNEGVSKDKIVTGIPFYGRFWKTGEAIGGIGIAANDVEFLMKNYHHIFRYDEATQSANVIITIQPGESEPRVWDGRILTAGEYNIWYDNLQASRFKLDTIYGFGVKGAGSWALGQENPGVWDFYTAALNGK